MVLFQRQQRDGGLNGCSRETEGFADFVYSRFWNSAFARRCFFRSSPKFTVNTSGIFLMSAEKESTMNTARNTFLALLTAAMAVPALADTGSSGVTREEVKAEYLRALKAGELDFAREFIPAPTRAATTSASATKVETLSPTGAGVAKTAAVTPAKTVN
jgi:hypothetical protein